jgi:hypothetical protein
MRAPMEEALNVYSETFTAADLAILGGVRDEEKEFNAVGADIRRRLRGKAVLDFARELNLKRNLGAQLKNGSFHDWINRGQ